VVQHCRSMSLVLPKNGQPHVENTKNSIPPTCCRFRVALARMVQLCRDHQKSSASCASAADFSRKPKEAQHRSFSNYIAIPPVTRQSSSVLRGCSVQLQCKHRKMSKLRLRNSCQRPRRWMVLPGSHVCADYDGVNGSLWVALS